MDARQPLPEGTAPWMGVDSSHSQFPGKQAHTGVSPSVLPIVEKPGVQGLPCFCHLACPVKRRALLLLAQEVNAAQTSDTYSHLTPTVVLFLNRCPVLLFSSMQYGCQECGC